MPAKEVVVPRFMVTLALSAFAVEVYWRCFVITIDNRFMDESASLRPRSMVLVSKFGWIDASRCAMRAAISSDPRQANLNIPRTL
jgi:hypothetical protein